MLPKPKRIVSQKAIDFARLPYCEHCLRWTQTQSHHVKSKGSGGNDEPDNLVSLCVPCHAKAHNGQISREALREIVMSRITRA